MEGTFRRPFPPDLTVIETLRLDPAGPSRLHRHLQRMERTARMLGLPFDRGRAERTVDAARAAEPRRVRLTLSRDRGLQLATAPLPDPVPVWRLGWAGVRICSEDPWRRVKTSVRAIYDDARAKMPEGIDELLLLNERGEVAEGTVTNVFVASEGGLLTPPVSAGALPGTVRAELIEAGRAREARLTPADLGAAELFVSNGVRGLVPARFDPRNG